MTADDIRHRARLLFVVLTALRLRVNRPPLLCDWLDNWTGVGLVAIGMARQGYDLQLTRYSGEGWRATFYPEGRSHSPTRHVGTGWEPTPWGAVQTAAWETLRKSESVA
jgi:hypothetical protein